MLSGVGKCGQYKKALSSTTMNKFLKRLLPTKVKAGQVWRYYANSNPYNVLNQELTVLETKGNGVKYHVRCLNQTLEYDASDTLYNFKIGSKLIKDVE